MENVNIQAYIDEKKKKEKKRRKAYKVILSGVNQEITESLELTNTILIPIPSIMLEVEDYNPLEALEYIIDKLCKNKQFIQIVDEIKIIQPCTLYIKWDLDKLTKK